MPVVVALERSQLAVATPEMRRVRGIRRAGRKQGNDVLMMSTMCESCSEVRVASRLVEGHKSEGVSEPQVM